MIKVKCILNCNVVTPKFIIYDMIDITQKNGSENLTTTLENSIFISFNVLYTPNNKVYKP